MVSRWLSPPKSEKLYQDFAYKVLHYSLLLMIVIILVIIPFQQTPARLLFGILTFLMLLSCFILLQNKRERLAAITFLVGCWVIVTLSAIVVSGIRTAGLSVYAIVIIYSAILFPGRTVIRVTVISVIASGLLLLGETNGLLPAGYTDTLMTDRFLPTAALFITSGTLLWLSVRAILEMVTELQQSEKSMKERNKQLEAEIYERRRIENDLRKSEAKYRILFDHSRIMAAVYDEEGHVILINDTTSEWLNIPPQELVGKTVFDILPPELAEKAQERHQRVRQTGIMETVEGQGSDSQGNVFFYLRQVVPLPEGEVLTLTMDVTAQKIQEAQELALKLAAEKADFLTEFFSTISHDLKTPLTVLNTTLYLVERSKSEEQRQQNLKRMQENIEVIQDYIQDMLTYARLEHLPSFARKKLDVHDLLHEVINRLRPRADGKVMNIETSFDPDLPPINASYDHLLRAFLNLLENAIAYTPDGGHVQLKTARAGENVEIIVSDTGVGIAPNDVQYIFNRFYRGSAAQEMDKGGSGLGLSIVKKVVTMHDGDVTVHSVAGEGTSFIVTLPKYEEPDA